MATELSLKELKDLLDDNELDLSVRGLTTIPKALVQIPRATEIDLGANKISFIYPEFCNMTRITRLELGSNKLVVLPDNIGNLVHLQHLNLYNNQIEELPLSFANLRSLNWLDLKKNPLTQNLAKAAGNCGSEKECKQAAVGVLTYMKSLKKGVDDSKAKQQKVHEKVQAINEAQQEKKKKKQQQQQRAVQTNKNEQAHADHEKKKHQDNMAKAAKRKEVKNVKQCSGGCFITNFIRFVFKIVFYISLLAFAGSTVQILFNCVEGGKKIPGSAPLCTDLNKLTEFKKPSDKFFTNAYNTYGVVLNGYKRTTVTYWNIGTKSISVQYKKFAKSDIGKSFESFFYKVHAFVLDKTLAVQRWASLQIINVKKWYDREGHKTIGGIVENVKVVGKIAFEIAKDCVSFVFGVAKSFYHRAEAFILVVQKQGFAKAVETLTAH
ncbi:unnamed protein product [Auanema sp. JU1783]|nr:unnamed protein product [Auanema sp. JU1783]